MSYIRIPSVGAVVEPVSLAEAKNHLRVDHEDDDLYISALIQAARETCESFTGRAIVEGDWRLTMDGFPFGRSIQILRCPVTAVTAVKYLGTDGTEKVLPVAGVGVSGYAYHTDLDGEPARVGAIGEWPAVGVSGFNRVKVEFTAGYPDGTVPKSICSAMLLIIGHLYENREEVVVGRQANQLPKASEYLLAPYRLFIF